MASISFSQRSKHAKPDPSARLFSYKALALFTALTTGLTLMSGTAGAARPDPVPLTPPVAPTTPVTTPDDLSATEQQAATQSTSEYRNLALRRAVVHSSAADFNFTGHMVTDGIFKDRGPGAGGVVDPGTVSGPVFTSIPLKNDHEGVQQLFDYNTGTKWFSHISSQGNWVVQVKLLEAAQAVSYSMTSGNDDDKRDPKAWELQGSHDGETWITIDSRSNIASIPARKSRVLYTIATPGSYTYYRIVFTANNGATDGGSTGPLAMQLSEIDLLSDAAGTQSIIRSDLNQPVLSTAGFIFPGSGVENLFDGKTSTMWRAWDEWGDNTTSVQIWLPRPAAVASYQLVTSSDTPPRDPSSWKLQGSNNAITWTDLDQKIGILPPPARQTPYEEISLSNTTLFTYYRLTLTANGGSVLKGIPTDAKRDYQLAELRLLDTDGNLIIPATGTDPEPSPTGRYSDLYDNSPTGDTPAQAFDMSSDTKWLAWGLPNWLQAELPGAATATTYIITTAHDYYDRDPKNWKVLGSNDGENFTVLDAQNVTLSTADKDSRKVPHQFAIANPGAYKYYRLSIDENLGDTVARRFGRRSSSGAVS